MLAATHPTSPDATQRIRALDVLRGIAILGTLASNIFVWVSIAGGQENIFSLATHNLRSLPNGKFLSLLTLMFGMGLMIQHDAALRRQQRWPQVYLWRAVLLFLDGLLHYLLVFTFDVLMSYAFTGVIVAYLLLTSRRTQRIVCIVASSIHVVAIISIDIVFYILALKDGPAWARDLARSQQEAAQQSWWDGVVERATDVVNNRLEALLILPMTFATFLLGSFLLRAGLFKPAGDILRRRLIITGAIAFIIDLALTNSILFIKMPIPGSTLSVFNITQRYLVSVFIACGIAAVAAQYYLNREPGWTGRRLEDVGRMALSCYVGQNVVCLFLFSGWALNLDARIPGSFGAGGHVLCFLLVALILLVFSWLWRRAVGQGPLERLWAVSYRSAMRLTARPSRPKDTTAG